MKALFFLFVFSFCSLISKEYAGSQAIVDLYGCQTQHINDLKWIERHLRKAALQAGGTIVKSEFHEFSPYGVSGVVIIAESHIAIHTWPEYDFVAVDIFTCSDDLKVQQAYEYLIDAFKAKDYDITNLKRGTRILNKNSYDK